MSGNNAFFVVALIEALLSLGLLLFQLLVVMYLYFMSGYYIIHNPVIKPIFLLIILYLFKI